MNPGERGEGSYLSRTALYGQCVAEAAKAGGGGGRSAVAKNKGTCTPPLVCTENADDPGTVTRNSRANTVTVAGSGEGSLGSNLSCVTDIRVTKGDTVTYTLPVSGTVTEVGFVYDRGDTGSVTYSKATIDGITLNI